MHHARSILAVLVVTAAILAVGRTHAAGLETLLMPGKTVRSATTAPIATGSRRCA
jgi:hypothetical protein